MSRRRVNASGADKPLADRGGSAMCGEWIPTEVWNQLGQFLGNPADIKSLRKVCVSGFNSVTFAQAPKISESMKLFCRLEFSIPPALMAKTVVMHPIIPDGRGLILLVDESAPNTDRGVELVWLERGVSIQVPLGTGGLPQMIAKKVSHVRFSPSGNELALLVTVNGGTAPDEINRFRAPSMPKGSNVEPQGESTVQIVELLRKCDGEPNDVLVHTYSHLFVPEYGFDLVWCPTVVNACLELVFVAMLHSGHGAATYLVRWSNFRETSTGHFVFMASIYGASHVFEQDKIKAVQEMESTQVTSRLELSEDGQSIFFDTISKCGVIKLDQDLIDREGSVMIFNADYGVTKCNLPGFGGPRQEDWSDYPKISRMSPDGSLVCTLVSMPSDGGRDRQKQVLNMLPVPDGVSIFSVVLHPGRSSPSWAHVKYDKRMDLASHVMGFSNDSSLFWVRPCVLTKYGCWIDDACLPAVFDSRSGRMVQDFGRVAQPYQFLQMAPNALTIFGTRPSKGAIAIDAIDIVSGKIVKTVRLPGVSPVPGMFVGSCCFRTSSSTVAAMVRGDVDHFWEFTRGPVGCTWEHKPPVKRAKDV